jgi:signal transduction histidine kinase
VIHTERERAIAEIRAELQERVRLSLWRMDSLGASILLEENAIPAQLFLNEPETTLPDLARFESPDGAAIRGTGETAALDMCSALLPGLVTDAKRRDENKKEEKDKESAVNEEISKNYVAPPQSKVRGGEEMQKVANLVEKANRDRWFSDAISNQSQTSYGNSPAAADSPSRQSRAESTIKLDDNASNPIGNFKPLWFKNSLFLVRRGMTMTTFTQGTLVDDAKLKELLLAEATQNLPEAKLTAVEGERGDSLILASFPFRLIPGGIGAAPGSTPQTSIPQTISISLLVGWLAVLIALLAAYFLIANVMQLSERRASFVSAVTHELRTPLTTFRLYSDMLSTGAVREEKKPMYLNVLSREADRLSHLVENVLAFSQIERGSARSTVTEVELNALLESFRERFSSRLDAAGLSLELIPVEPITTKLDTSALEHILFNLIDNAAKYAAASEPALVSIEPSVRKGEIEIKVCDHGPGISKAECRRIFRAFHKSAKQAAETKPGVGLGLALSKRLAASMGGSLSCQSRSDGGTGAEFSLKLSRR